MADFDAQLPVRAIPTEFATEVANAAGTIINPVEEFPQASTTSGQSGPLDQAAVTAAAPVYADGTTSPLSLDLAGNLRTTGTFLPSGTQNVNVTEVGGNPVTTTIPVSGTVTVVQATGTNLHTVVDNFPADADALAQGSTTAGQLGALDMTATTTAAPTYVTATTNPLSTDTAGNLRVIASPVALQNVNLTEIGGNAITTTVPVSGTVTSNIGTTGGLALDATLTNGTQVTSINNFPATVAVTQSTSPWVVSGTVVTSPDVNIHDGTGVSISSTGSSLNVDVTNTVPVTGTFWQATQPVSGTVTVTQATGTNLHAVIDNFPADADALAQGSTTSGQLGALEMGAVTTAAPTYTTGTTNSLSLDTAGNLRTSTIITEPAAILTYFIDAAVATSATVTHSVAGPTNLDAVWGTGSGEIKLKVAIGITGSEVVYFSGFTSAAVQDIQFALKNTYVIPAGSSVKVTILNRDTTAQDVYMTIVTH